MLFDAAKYRNAGAGGPDHSHLLVSLGLCTNHDVAGRVLGYMDQGVCFSIPTRDGRTVVLNREQALHLAEKITKYFDSPSPTPHSSVRMIEEL